MQPEQIALLCIEREHNYQLAAEEKLQSRPDKPRKSDHVIFNTKLSSERYDKSATYTRGLSWQEVDEVMMAAEDHQYDVHNLLEHHPDYMSNRTSLSTAKRQTRAVDGEQQELPRNYQDALSPELVAKFGPATEVELADMVKYAVMTAPTTVKPVGVQILDTKWTFDVKTDREGHLIRYKARLVLRGFLMRYLEHYRKTYSPTAFKESVRLILYLITACKFHQFLFDVKVAFLHGIIDNNNIWLKYPAGMPGWIDGSEQYCRLLKALYGSKQASLIFYEFLCNKLPQLGYTQSINDPCLWFRRDEQDRLSVLCTHVDDIPG
jgi:hypothetical protein